MASAEEQQDLWNASGQPGLAGGEITDEGDCL
jgi:hypothetical protein